MLHNFGGTPGMYGNLSEILTQPYLDRKIASNMVGIGITMEAIGQNYVLYEAMLEAKWRSDPVDDVSEWLLKYITRRYGENPTDDVINAWDILLNTVYSSWSYNVSLIEFEPSFLLITSQSYQFNFSIDSLW